MRIVDLFQYSTTLVAFYFSRLKSYLTKKQGESSCKV